MKKVLVLTAVLFLMSSISRASILEAWLTFATGGPEDTWGNSNDSPTTAGPDKTFVGQLYTVELWIKIVADPNIPGETVTGCGLYTTALTIVSSGATVATEPNMLGNDPLGADTTDAPTTVDSYFNNAGSLNDTIKAARQEAFGTQYQWGTANTGLDALQMSVSTSITTKTVAVNKAFLFGEENWLLESWSPADLHLEIAPTSNHWDSLGDEITFSQFETGSLNSSGVFTPGVDLTVGPVPEPATLALLGFGAVATLLRRRNKK